MRFKIDYYEQSSPLKIVVYGIGGVGKSTFASTAPKPIFMNLEDNIRCINVAKVKLTSYQEVEDFLTDLYNASNNEYRTLVIDSVDVLASLLYKHIAKKYNINDFTAGFGKGYAFVNRAFEEFIATINLISNAKKMNVIMICQEAQKSEGDIEIGDHIKKNLALEPRFLKPVTFWANIVLGLATKHTVHKEKIVGQGERVMYKVDTGTRYAKNSYGLPPELPIDWGVFSEHIKSKIIQTKTNEDTNTEVA